MRAVSSARMILSASIALLLGPAPCVCASGLAANRDKRQDGASAIENGRHAFEVSDYSKATQVLLAAAAADPQNPEIHLLLAKTYYELQQHDSAIAAAERAVTLNPKSSVYHEWLGRAFGQKAEHAMWFSAIGLAKKTRKEFQIAVDLDERNFSAQQALIEFDCSAPGIVGGGEDKARVDIARVAALDEAEGYYGRGVCRREKKDFASADAEFTKALEAHPTSASLIYDIGDYAVRRQQGNRLLAIADAGEKVDPEDSRGEYYRAVGLILKNENLAEADRLLRTYLSHARVRADYPRLSWVHEWLGRLLEIQGNPEAARAEYESALKLDPKTKAAKEALKRMGKNPSSDD